MEHAAITVYILHVSLMQFCNNYEMKYVYWHGNWKIQNFIFKECLSILIYFKI